MNISYYPMSDRNAASSRLRVYKIADELTKLGHGVMFDKVSVDTHVVVVQKCYGLDTAIQNWRNAGIRVIFDVDDLIDLPIPDVDQITADTPYKVGKWPSAKVVPDCLDIDSDSPFKDHHNDALKTAVYCANADNIYHIANALEACRWVGVQLTIITDLTSPAVKEMYSKLNLNMGGVRLVQWKSTTVDAVMVEHDLVVCPFVYDGRWGRDWVESKSANKILKAWALGLPCAGTGILSYLEAGLQHMAGSIDEWCEVLGELEDPQVRFRDAARGAQIANKYRADKVVNKWLEVMAG